MRNKKLTDLKSFIYKASSLGLSDISTEDKKELLKRIENPKERSKILSALKKRMPKDLNTFDNPL